MVGKDAWRGTIPLFLRIDVVAGVLVSALAALIWYGSSHLPVGELRYFGPGFMPRLCAAALLVGGLALLFRGLTQPDTQAEPLVLAMRGPLLVGLGILLFALTIRGYGVGPIIVPQFGLLAAGCLVIFISGLGSVEARPRELIVLAFGLSGLGALLFVDVLDVRLPVLPDFVERNLPPQWGIEWPARLTALGFMTIAAMLARYFRKGLGSKPVSGPEAR
ncbi:tripartite tricarboxylate transporter TctB family protein [Chelativorans sp. Marseille-P2723]|uniref:tripartite tricarboxylate transporter TctB family protein n=1 Tax=Chelativorans sp. Marseille-P2723 TaxID=2709133 RepID=UPI001570E993|nr:tripartite tricarboxylate transporter TctB family protein [Chelativorans sp. Marseille-P2723]